MWFTPTLGLHPPTLLLYCLHSISYKHKAFKTLTPHRTEDLRSSLDPSSLRYNTNPSTICYKELHLALQVAYSHAQSTYRLYLHLAYIHITWMHYFSTPYIAYPFIYTYQIGLHMSKPMGRHPNPVTYSQKPKKGPRSCDIHFIPHSSFDRLSKSQNRSL
jgi:hypothetical protein